MAREYFYHALTRKVIVAFATIFDEIDIVVEGQTIRVPLHYSPKSKLIDNYINADMDALVYDVGLPRMGFEITGMNYAPERVTNSMHVIGDPRRAGEQNEYTWNRVPYDYIIDLHIATVRFEDSLQIVEQILPFFRPELNLTIKDLNKFELETNVPVILNSVSMQLDYEGSLDTRRIVTWTLSFTVRAYMYGPVIQAERIKKAITEMHVSDFKSKFDRLVSEVVPREAGRDDPHTIVDSREEGISDDG